MKKHWWESDVYNHPVVRRLQAELEQERARVAELSGLCASLATTSDAMKLQLILNGCLDKPRSES